jgi:hypothetical protein
MKNKGIYTGIRFTTLTFAIMCKRNIEPIFFPGVGDIVVWRDHMGIVDGPNSFYSALSSRSGIKSTPIKSHAGQPQYYRIWTPDKASISSGFSGGLEGNPGKAKDNVIP